MNDDELKDRLKKIDDKLFDVRVAIYFTCILVIIIFTQSCK